MRSLQILVLLSILAVSFSRRNEFIRKIERIPTLNFVQEDLFVYPEHFSWGNIDGTSYLTKNLNQHIPQYCGSCWAHGAMSALADRIKILRKGKGIEINLSIQYILNCGDAGTCYGGDQVAAYHFVKEIGYVPYDTCQQYSACSYDSTEGFCKHSDWNCTQLNTCRTCSTFTPYGGQCVGVYNFPNASIEDYGWMEGVAAMKQEIYKNGPIACGVNGNPLVDYTGGIINNNKTEDKQVDHIISIVGWGTSKKSGNQYWIVRNSWGSYWGEMGYFRITMGENQLGIESDCAWATVKSFTEINFPVYEDGTNDDEHFLTSSFI